MSAEFELAGSAAPRRPRRLALLIVERVLLLVALATLGYVAGSVGGAALYQEGELHRLRGRFAEAERAYADASAWGAKNMATSRVAKIGFPLYRPA